VTATFDPRGRVIFVSATIEGPSGTSDARLLLDTGAAFTALRPSLLARLGYDLSERRTSIRIASATGYAEPSLIIVERVTWLTVERRNLGVLALPLPNGVRADGVLGINFLRGTRLTIDFRAGQIAVD
jgi:predicted aspartyl protease